MLFGKEMKKTIFSITFFVFICALFAMSISQEVLNFSDKVITKPQPGENYGVEPKEVPELIMPAAFASLFQEFTSNQYIAYPIGFYKNIKLKDADQAKMAEILSLLSGISVDKLEEYRTDSDSQNHMQITFDESQNVTAGKDGTVTVIKEEEPPETKNNTKLSLSPHISYEIFKECMKQADSLIGGGSNYSESNLLNFSYVAVTYEEALENYNSIANTDKFTGTYARLFCDYIGVILSILPVFIAVALCLKDKRGKMRNLIDTRKISSCKLIFVRYFSIVTAIMLPTILLAYVSNLSVWGQYKDVALDYFAPLTYSIGWLLPSVMITTAIGMFFTELTGTPIAIAIQGLWWFIDLNVNIRKIRGVHSLLELTPRHNSLGNTQLFLEEFNTLAANRLIITGIALLLIVATVFIYEEKRRGNLGGYGKTKTVLANLGNHKSEFKA